MSLFNNVHDRNKTRSVKWGMLQTVFQTNDVLPMWVADMDFSAPSKVNEAIIERAKHGIYGYTAIDQDVKQAIINWLASQHNWEVKPQWLSFSPSVVTSLHIAIQALTQPNDKVMIQTPVYTPFYNIIKSHGREIIKNPLTFQNNKYYIDFNDFEDNLKRGVKAFILCSPHNPVGRVWTQDELHKMAELCLKYNVLILADEVHADLIFPGHQHIPISTLSDEVSAQTITFNAPSKTFNLAGLQASYIITENFKLRELIDQHLERQGLTMLNTMGNIALEAAYTYGKEWLQQLISVLTNNRNYVIDRLTNETNYLEVVQSEGTYLLWINCERLGMDSKTLNQFFIQEAKVGLNAGVSYGKEGEQFMRMNIACPSATIKDGTNRIIQAVNKLTI